MSVGRLRWTWRSTCSTACRSWDARSTSASPDPDGVGGSAPAPMIHAPRWRVVDRDTAVLQHQFEIAVADREHQIPAHGPQDHRGRELPALELLALSHATCAAIRLVETARLSNPDPPHKLATEPKVTRRGEIWAL